MTEARPGYAILGIVVSEDGSVVTADVLCENPEAMGYGDIAKASVAKWQFPPDGPGLFKVTLRFAFEE